MGQLNRQLQTLTAQALALEQQNTLNSHSTHGVYLLPSAKNSAILESNIGKLSISLSHIEPEANGTQALLHVRLLEGTALPAFHAQLDWGQLDPVSSKPLPSEIHPAVDARRPPIAQNRSHIWCAAKRCHTGAARVYTPASS